jgi:hypothetical protein
MSGMGPEGGAGGAGLLGGAGGAGGAGEPEAQGEPAVQEEPGLSAGMAATALGKPATRFSNIETESLAVGAELCLTRPRWSRMRLT